jgi:replicative DNA helicase
MLDHADRLPPHNRAAERGVIGSMLRWPACIDDVGQIVKAESFYAGNLQILFRAILDLHGKGKTVDSVAVAEWLDARGKVQDAGGFGILAELWDETPIGCHAVHHAGIVREYAVMRGLLYAAREIEESVTARCGSATELLEAAEKQIFKLAEEGTLGTTVDLPTSIDEAFARLDRRRAGDLDSGDCVPTGFVDLDKVLAGGLQCGELILLGARTSVGKSALAVNFLRAAALVGMPSFIASLEMSRLDLAERFLILESRVDGQRLRTAMLSPDDKRRLMDAGDVYAKAALVEIDDTPSQSMMRIAANARRLKLRKGIRLVVVDYLQLVEAEDKRAQRYEQVGSISRRLKMLARELKLPVVALVQVNRGPEQRANGKPRLSDLREAGNLEQDADTVILLREGDSDGVAIVDVAKQRNGPKEEVLLTFCKQWQRFENYAHQRPFAYSDA